MKTGMSLPAYDIELDTDCCDPYNNAELTITLKLGFRKIDPSGGANEGTYHDYGDATDPTRKIIKWTDAAWSSWKGDFIRSAQAYWHGKFWLVNRFPDLDYEVKGVKYRPNIWCRFKLEGGDAVKGGFNHVIDVVRLHATENWFGSHSTLYDSKDTKSVSKGTDSAGKKIMQRAHVHEVGHLLGLAHVDVGKAHCPTTGNTNASACYGVADADKNSVMGSGMQLRGKHANPWRSAVADLTGKGFGAIGADWVPKTVRHYPRTLAEAAANAAITRRLAR